MSGETTSANMSLPIPGVGVTSGPTWGTDLNSCLSIIDAHTHAPGSGVQITPSGINISSDLTIASNNLTNIRSARFAIQGAPLALVTDLGCLYESGVDLYFNDGNGNKIQITDSGGVAGTPGSIGSLVSPATATYVGATPAFVFQSDSNVAASLDGRSLVLRNSTASSFGLTLSPPNAMGADYSVVLPSLPGSTSFVSIDASGNMAATLATSGGITATQLAANSVTTSKIADANVTTIKILDANVTTAKIADLNVTTGKINTGAVTQVKKAIRTMSGSTASAGNVAISASCGEFVTTSTSYVAVTNLEVVLTTLGGPVRIELIPASASNFGSYVGTSIHTGTDGARMTIGIYEDGVEIGTTQVTQVAGLASGSGSLEGFVPPGAVSMMSVPAAGAHTYKIYVTGSSVVASTSYARVEFCKLMAYEL